MTTASLLDALDRTRNTTKSHFELPPAELARSYAPGKWSVRFLLHHLADAETVLFDRIRRILSEPPRTTLRVFDQDAWARALDYETRPLDLSRDLYLSTRAGVRFYVERVFETHGDIEWVHSETGVRTLRDEMEKVASHNAQHLEQIAAAIRSGASR